MSEIVQELVEIGWQAAVLLMVWCGWRARRGGSEARVKRLELIRSFATVVVIVGAVYIGVTAVARLASRL